MSTSTPSLPVCGKGFSNDTLDLLFNENDGILSANDQSSVNLDTVLPSHEGGMLPDIDIDALLNTDYGANKDIIEEILTSPKDSSLSPDNDSMLDSPPYIQPETKVVTPDVKTVTQDHSYFACGTTICDLSFDTLEMKHSPYDATSVNSSPPNVDVPVFISDDLDVLESRQRSAPGPIRHVRRSRASSGSNSGLPYTIHDIHITPGSPSSDSHAEEDCNRSGSRISDDSFGLPGERLILTDEERILLAKEGMDLPDRLPLTREEERVLRTIRRKIRNKISAKNSRLKKQEYVVGLEQRVKLCSKENRTLRGSVDSLKSQNRQLMTEVRRLRQWISCRFPEFGSVSAGGAAKAGLYTLFLSFALVLTPMLSPFWPSRGSGEIGSVMMSKPSVLPGRTRMLLQEREAAVKLGDPYHITIRPAGPPWQNPPKTAAIALPVPVTPSKTASLHPESAGHDQNSTDGTKEVDETVEEDVDSDSRGNEL